MKDLSGSPFYSHTHDLDWKNNRDFLDIFFAHKHGVKDPNEIEISAVIRNEEKRKSLLEWAMEQPNATNIALEYLCLQLGKLLYSQSTPSLARLYCGFAQDCLVKQARYTLIVGNANALAKALLSDQRVMVMAHIREDIKPKDFLKKLTEIISAHEKLVTGEWAARALAVVENVRRSENANTFDTLVHTSYGWEYTDIRDSLSYFPKRPFVSRVKQSGFYNIDSKDPLEAYLACVYQVNFDLFTNPLGTKRNSLFSPSFFRFSPEQIEIIENLGKTKPGIRYLSSSDSKTSEVPTYMPLSDLIKGIEKDRRRNPMRYSPAVFSLGKPICNLKQYQYADSIDLGSYYPLDNLLKNLEEECKKNSFVDPRYVALCHFITLPTTLPLEEKARLVFGSSDQKTIEKISYLLQFVDHAENRKELTKVFLAYELRSYLPHYKPQELMDLTDVLIYQLGRHGNSQRIIDIFREGPESALVLLQETKLHEEFILSPGGGRLKKTRPFTYMNISLATLSEQGNLSESFFKANEKEILALRFGENALINRRRLSQDIERIINTADNILRNKLPSTLNDQVYDYFCKLAAKPAKGPQPWL